MDLYTDYEGWKGWTKPFTATPDERAYFEGETRDVKIRAADVLEIGFGSGSFLAWARERGARIAGSEINETLLTAAREEGIELLPAASTLSPPLMFSSISALMKSLAASTPARGC